MRSGGRVAHAFQFHKGTIRTVQRVWIIVLFRHFNSIKVRLEQEIAGSMSVHRNFNSIKVRLERATLGTRCNRGPLFQFHKGTIRTFCVISLFGRVGHFNSIKVRLERCRPRNARSRPTFQFHKGTIRTWEPSARRWTLTQISIP